LQTRSLCLFERQNVSQNPRVGSHDVQAIACLHDLRKNTGRTQAKERAFKFRHGVAAANLTQVAAMLSRRTIRQLPGHRCEPLRLAQKLIQSPLCAGAQRNHVHARHKLEQNVPRMHQIADCEFMAVMLTIAWALRLRRFWGSHLPLQESTPLLSGPSRKARGAVTANKSKEHY
jgi:hypothetical protein